MYYFSSGWWYTYAYITCSGMELRPAWSHSRVNWKICLKSAGWQEFFFVFGVFGWSCVVLFEGASSYKEMPELSWSIWARKNWAALPLNCSKIGHSYEAFKYLFDGNISTPLLSAIKNSSADLLNSGVTRNFRIIWKYQVLEFSRRDLIRFFLIVNKLSPRIRIRTFLKFVARANERSVVRNFDCSEKRSWCILAKKLCEFFTWVS